MKFSFGNGYITCNKLKIIKFFQIFFIIREVALLVALTGTDNYPCPIAYRTFHTALIFTKNLN